VPTLSRRGYRDRNLTRFSFRAQRVRQPSQRTSTLYEFPKRSLLAPIDAEWLSSRCLPQSPFFSPFVGAPSFCVLCLLEDRASVPKAIPLITGFLCPFFLWRSGDVLKGVFNPFNEVTRRGPHQLFTFTPSPRRKYIQAKASFTCSPPHLRPSPWKFSTLPFLTPP